MSCLCQHPPGPSFVWAPFPEVTEWKQESFHRGWGWGSTIPSVPPSLGTRIFTMAFNALCGSQILLSLNTFPSGFIPLSCVCLQGALPSSFSFPTQTSPPKESLP